MLDVQQALGAAARPAARTTSAARRVLVVGAGGTLGAAVLEQLLATQRFEHVGALAEQPIQPAMRSFVPVAERDVEAFGADSAVVVFDRTRLASGREAAFAAPAPGQLPALAARLHAGGVRHLVVAVPHSPSLLPMALQQGLASLDEAAVAALGFAHLSFMRMAQSAVAEPAPDAPRRLARWMLSQLRWMIPQREQPVRVDTVARVAAALAVHASAAPGTRVLPAALLWQAAQRRDAAAVVLPWLAGQGSHG
jgi:hypothetical protein